MDAYWTYIRNMLMSMKQMPLDRMHSMLGMFMRGAVKYTATVDELRDFLDSKVEEGDLQKTGNVYKLTKKS